MLPVLTSAEMREADRRTIQEIGLPGAVLMENAGAAVAAVFATRFPGARQPVILCGKGNNGGDGFVVARRLLSLAPTAFLFAARAEVRGDALVHMGAFERSGGRLIEVRDDTAWDEVRSQVLAARLVVDALLGTGLRQEPTGLLGRVIREVQAARGQGMTVLAVDIPSGVSSDMGEAPWESLSADLTVTFAARKYGQVLAPACDRVGELLVADIGIPRSVIDAAGPKLWVLEKTDAAQAVGRREPGSHKGNFGRVLIVAGSVGKTGAAILAASGALRMGAGLVTVATPEPAL
ncbi:MAG TPA: NAD(P)H-hydrate epimerase, partial [Vicinamibacteria bacterium]|nr:NAD(P)H-hydrate epimerase [Vicinamibacteria bacterium]